MQALALIKHFTYTITYAERKSLFPLEVPRDEDIRHKAAILIKNQLEDAFDKPNDGRFLINLVENLL